MNTRIFLPLMVVFLFFVAACDLQPEATLSGSGDLANNIQPIYNGYPPDAPEHDAVVGLHQLSKDGLSVYVSPFCTGTLIADDLVITAAHCLDVGRAFKFKEMNPSYLAIYVGDDPAVDILDHLYLVDDTVIYPSYDRLALRNDIALVRLATPIVEAVDPVAPLPVELGFAAADIGMIMNIAGFGQTETGSSGVKLQADVPLGSLGCELGGCPDPGDAATQIAYVQDAAGPCFGDSGGPAFVYRDAVPYVGGITSYGDSYCTIYGVSTRVDAFGDWIDSYLAPPVTPDCSEDGYCNPECEEGEDPDCAAPPPTDCGNGVCDEGESCDGRYDTVDCPADCDGLKTGKPSGRYCYVGDTCEGGGCP